MKEIQPLVSISCLTYNHEPFIRQCLNGFVMQKTSFTYEVLIHDDASTDKTADIIHEYEQKYPEIIKPIYEKENQWNKGRKGTIIFNLPRAKGKYIALCEGDDYWIDPHKLQKQVDFLEDNPEYAMVYTLSQIYNQKKNTFEENLFGSEYKGYDNLLAYNQISTLTTCIRSKVMLDYIDDIKPQKRKWLMGDYPMWLWIGYYYKIKFFPYITSVYRVLEESASHSKDIERNEKFILSTIDITTFYIKKFNLSPSNTYYHALNDYYILLYNEFKNVGNYIKAMQYAKLINNKYTTSRTIREKRKFYIKHMKLWLLNTFTSKKIRLFY